MLGLKLHDLKAPGLVHGLPATGKLTVAVKLMRVLELSRSKISCIRSQQTIEFSASGAWQNVTYPKCAREFSQSK
jgi:hypothetical protein